MPTPPLRPGGAIDHPDGTRSCIRCSTRLPLEKFKKCGTGKHKRQSQCNRCLYVNYTRPEAQKKMAEVHAYKVAQGCADCGYNLHPAALEFDHRPGEVKLFNIGEKIGSYSREKISAEIAKCDVVCANCHVIRTVERRTLVT